MMEYETLEQSIMKLWKSRGMDVKTIEFHAEKNIGIWTIKAPISKKI